MEWDTRIWSFFVWLITTVVYVAGYVTPYSVVGNRVDVIVAFGGDVDPRGERVGLWGEVPEDLATTMMAVRIVLSLPLACCLINLVGYIMLFKLGNNTAQVLAFVSQLLGGILAIVGVGLYRGASDQLGEGWWLCCMAGCLFLVNGIVLLFMPIMEFAAPSWKSGGKKKGKKDQVELVSVKNRRQQAEEEAMIKA